MNLKVSLRCCLEIEVNLELEKALNRIGENWQLFASAPDSLNLMRQLIIDAGIHGQLFGKTELGTHGYPANWEVSDFKSICDIEGGNQPPKSVFVSEERPDYVQLFQIRDLGLNPIPVFIPKKLARSTSVEGEILVGRYGASVGKIFKARTGAYNVALVKFIFPKDKLISDFVYWFLKSSRSQALFTGMSRSAQAGFNKRDLAPLLIPIPEKEEQTRIVKLIQDSIDKCDALEIEMQKAAKSQRAAQRSAVDAFSLAKSPVEHKLAWERIRNNWNLFSESLEGISLMRLLIHDLALKGVFGGSDSFAETNLSELSQISYGYTEKAQTENVGPKFLRITDIQRGKVQWEKVPHCHISDSDEAKHLLVDGDLVFARTGATTGKSFLLKNPPRSVCASYLIRVRPDQSRVIPEYLYLYFQSGKYWADVRSGITGTAQGGFNSSKLGNLSIQIPSLESQFEIVTKVNQLLNICDLLEDKLNKRDGYYQKFTHSVSMKVAF